MSRRAMARRDTIRRTTTSSLRIAANRRNAQKSTGPRTPEGKARSSRNARKHGLSAPVQADPSLLRAIDELTLELAGRGAGVERRERAARVASAQAELACARQAREALYGAPLDPVELAGKLESLDRYERRARSRRKFAIRA